MRLTLTPPTDRPDLQLRIPEPVGDPKAPARRQRWRRTKTISKMAADAERGRR